jgi:GalNAc-alpha-(1->4)-GalNAc-alpha-(1->3)-diNAcBac-PP-undecaprenol alpha-1,4-N-acetyl-D-galactosaminyltransferase
MRDSSSIEPLVNRSILHVIASLEGGGAERQLAMLASEQVRRGHRVAIALRRRGVNDRGDVEIIELGDRAGASAMLLVRLARIVGDFDVVQTWLPQMDVHGGIAALARRVPWVMTERCVAAAYPDTFANRTRRWLARRASAIVANSCAGAEMWPGSLAIPNAVWLAPSRRPGPPMFVFAGRLDVQKRPDLVVEAAAKARARVIMFGEGPLHDQLRADIARLGADVTLAGYRSDWTDQLSTATALIAPSAFEGEPNVILEAMAAGCPIVASDIPAHRALLDERWLAPLDASAIAAKMTELLANPVAVYALGDRSIAAVADRYDDVYATM